jgi:hypothetical protein
MGLGIVALNWMIVWRGLLRKQETASWVPVLGALLCAAGTSVLPVAGLTRWIVAPFVVDWGSVPGITHAIGWHLRRRGTSA